MTAAPVAPVAFTDERIQQDVIEELKFDPLIKANEIGVAVKDGIVTLSGRVESFQQNWAAEEAALRVRGVVAVVNDIEVHLPGISERSDEDIAAAAVRALQWDANLSTEDIKVTVSQGRVTLSGEVDWHYQRDEAERAIRRLTGVRGISNLISVRHRQAPTPAELRKRIEAALVRSAQMDAERINVEIQGDKVILTGTVRSWAEKVEANRVAWSIPGVREVDNRINVQVP
jgi:osmotically-inducible protein OsmY